MQQRSCFGAMAGAVVLAVVLLAGFNRHAVGQVVTSGRIRWVNWIIVAVVLRVAPPPSSAALQHCAVSSQPLLQKQQQWKDVQLAEYMHTYLLTFTALLAGQQQRS